MSTKPYIAVAGGVNIDIGGMTFSSVIPRDSNPGKVNTSLGGVGRNIAHNLRLLGHEVVFFTAVGCDHYGQRILTESERLGMDLSCALKVPDVETSTYVFLGGPDGEMELAVSDMRICERLTPEYFEMHLAQINQASLLVIDANIPQDSIEYLTKNVEIPIFVDMVSTTKSRKIKPYLSGLHTIKPNRIEAQILTDMEITDEPSLRAAGLRLLDMGVKNAYISLSGDGIMAFSREGYSQVPVCQSHVVNVTGAGDASLAALCHSFLLAKSSREAAMYANAAASIAIESEETVSELMSVDKLEEKIRGNYLKE